MEAPIVLIHKGDSSYLFNSLYMLNRYHSKSNIFLIGDNANAHYSDWCTHFQFDNFSQKAEELRPIYWHKSVFSYEHELFCLQRWMVLESFMAEHQLTQAIYLDSDVLVYDHLPSWLPKFSGYGMSIVGVSGHTNFVQSAATLAKFNRYVIDKYSTEEGKATIQDWYDEHMRGKADHGISDMDMLTHFAEENPEEVVNLETYFNQFVFDRSFSESNGFEIEAGTRFKKVFWDEEKPSLKSLGASAMVPAITLHFQGNIKQNQRAYLPKTDFNFTLWNTYFKIRCLMNKIESRILSIV
jgi:hypothetical protein